MSLIGNKMKYLVFLNLIETDLAKIARKLQQYEEVKKKDPDKYPETTFPVHVMYQELQGVTIWEGNEGQVARKVAFDLPEIQCTLIPIMDGREFLKMYMEVKK